jgi:hypothetical protein
MPTRQASSTAPPDPILDLHDAGPRAGYASDYLRKLMWSADPPPLFKRRGKWVARQSELDAWIARRDGEGAA